MTATAVARVGYQRIPKSVALAIVDSAHPDIPWQPPQELPPLQDLRDAVRCLGERLQPCPQEVAKKCFAELVVVFEPGTKLGAEETRLRFAAWFAALRDIPEDLFVEATQKSTSSLQWFPKPVQFRETVARKLEERHLMVARAKQLTDIVENANRTAAFVQDPPLVRLETLLRWAEARGDREKVRRYRAEVRALQGLPAEEMDPDPRPPADYVPGGPVTTPGPSPRMREIAAEWHSSGKAMKEAP